MFVSKKKISSSNWLKIKSSVSARSPIDKDHYIEATLPSNLYRDNRGWPIQSKAALVWSCLIGKIPSFRQGVYYEGFKTFRLMQLKDAHACFIGSDRIKSPDGVVVTYILDPSHYLDIPDNNYRLKASAQLRPFPKDLVLCVTCILTMAENRTISLQVVELRNLKAVSCQIRLPLSYEKIYPMRAW